MTSAVDLLGNVAAVIAAASLWNAYQFSVLKGRVDAHETTLTAHINAPGLHQ